MQHISAWLQNPIIIQAIAAVVQTATAIVIVVLTAKLVSSTRHYADLTRQSLDISRKQFEREWLPELHISVVRDGNQLKIHIANLCKHSLVVTHVFVRKPPDELPLTLEVDVPIASSDERDTGDLTRRIYPLVHTEVNDYRWKGLLIFNVGYPFLGVTRSSVEVCYEVAFENGYPISIEAQRAFVAAAARTASGEKRK